MSTLDIGLSLMNIAQRKNEVTAHNISGVQNTGEKAMRMDLTDNFYNTLKRSVASAGENTSNQGTIQVGAGAKITNTRSNFLQGIITKTGERDHMAISGDGFFMVVSPSNNEKFLKRAGDFRKDTNDYIVTQDGNRLQVEIYGTNKTPVYNVTQDSNGKLIYAVDSSATASAATTVSQLGDMRLKYAGNVTSGHLIKDSGVTASDDDVNALAPKAIDYEVSKEGEITVKLEDGNSYRMGRVLLAKAKDPQALERRGHGLYASLEAAQVETLTFDKSIPSRNGLGSIESRALEESNISLTDEFGDLMKTQILLQAGSKVAMYGNEGAKTVLSLL